MVIVPDDVINVVEDRKERLQETWSGCVMYSKFTGCPLVVNCDVSQFIYLNITAVFEV
jgi:hypothetical protein